MIALVCPLTKYCPANLSFFFLYFVPSVLFSIFIALSITSLSVFLVRHLFLFLLPFKSVLFFLFFSLSSLSVNLSQVKVLYGGTELFDDEVRRTFHSDMLLAVFSGACISVLVYILTSFSGTPSLPGPWRLQNTPPIKRDDIINNRFGQIFNSRCFITRSLMNVSAEKLLG